MRVYELLGCWREPSDDTRISHRAARLTGGAITTKVKVREYMRTLSLVGCRQFRGGKSLAWGYLAHLLSCFALSAGILACVPAAGASPAAAPGSRSGTPAASNYRIGAGDVL